MLARPGVLPPDADHAFEIKWDGVRALVAVDHGLEVKGRHGRDLTDLCPELADLPAPLVLDGELVAFGDDGRPCYPLLFRRLLGDESAIPLCYLVFDLLRVRREATMNLPYRERRRRLEALDLHGRFWQTPPTYSDGEALFAAVHERGLEGVVAKRVTEGYRPGEPGWVKVDNRDYRRYERARDGFLRRLARRRSRHAYA